MAVLPDKAVVGYAHELDNILPIPQDPHYPRGLYTSTRARYIPERCGMDMLVKAGTHTYVHTTRIHMASLPTSQ